MLESGPGVARALRGRLACRQREPGQIMNWIRVIGICAAIGMLGACSTPEGRTAQAQESAYKSQQKIADERLKLVHKYQGCVKSAGGDKQKETACESYPKAADALK
jgi:hypothetical protein